MSEPTPVSASDTVAAVPGFHERRVGAQAFVLQPDSTMHVLDNPSAVFLWDAIREAGPSGIALERLAAHLAASYAVDDVTAIGDVLSFTRKLQQAGLIRRLGGSGD